MAGWLDHRGLKIIKGIGKTPGDNNSAENDPVVVNLLSNLITLAPDGWSPNIPATKNGGVWADSPVSDGRQLIAAAAGNVTEKMTLIISDNSYLGMIKAYLGLNKMAQDCRAFWETQTQIEPVYLAWWAGCGAGEQYALIYNIELAPEYVDGAQPTIRVSVTIEREPYWRGIPPGANPKIWSYYVNTGHPQFDSGVATLVTLNDHLITQTIRNKAEWTPAAFGLQSTFITQNFIDIADTQVPGDAPALVEMSITADSEVLADVYVARHSKKQTGKGHDGITRVNSLNLNVGDGVVNAITKTILAGTIKSNGSAVNEYEGLRTSTGIDAFFDNQSVQWGETGGGPGLIKLDREFFRGTFAIFCRCANTSAAAPVVSDMRIRVLIQEYENNANQYLTQYTSNEANPPISVGSNFFPVYLGTVTLPFEKRAVTSPLGYGIQLQESNSNLRVILQQKVDVATANRTFEVIDLIFMPIDEAMAQISFLYQSASATAVALMDNTGYSGHGDNGQFADGYVSNANSGGVGQQLRGQDITLLPHTNQRLYFLADSSNGGTTQRSIPGQSLTVRLNIVPRWSGIRDT